MCIYFPSRLCSFENLSCFNSFIHLFFYSNLEHTSLPGEGYINILNLNYFNIHWQEKNKVNRGNQTVCFSFKFTNKKTNLATHLIIDSSVELIRNSNFSLLVNSWIFNILLQRRRFSEFGRRLSSPKEPSCFLTTTWVEGRKYSGTATLAFFLGTSCY